MKLKLILTLLFIFNNYIEAFQVNSIYKDERIIANLDNPKSFQKLENICNTFDDNSCYTIENLSIFDKNIAISLPIYSLYITDNVCNIRPYYYFISQVNIDNISIIEFGNAISGKVTTYIEVKKSNDKLMLTTIKNVYRGYITTDDEDMEEGYFIESKEFNTDIKDIIDFSKLHYLIDNGERFFCSDKHIQNNKVEFYQIIQECMNKQGKKD